MGISKLSLEGKVAIITGAKRGIGRAIALAFAEAGADVVVCTRVVEDGKLKAVAEEIRGFGRRSLAVQTDVTKKTDVDNLVERVVDEFGSIDILVNNAVASVNVLLLELSEDDWDLSIDTSLKGYFLFCQAVGRKMVARKKGSIINIGALAAWKPPERGGVYAIAKTGIVMLTRILARELAPYNIRVNAIAPGLVKTEATAHMWDNPEWLKRQESTAPQRRVAAEPSEIADVALFLVSDASSYITGQTIIADGGALTS